jgi:hypothetical protein
VLHPSPDQHFRGRPCTRCGLAYTNGIVEQNFIFTHEQQKRGQSRKVREYG